MSNLIPTVIRVRVGSSASYVVTLRTIMPMKNTIGSTTVRRVISIFVNLVRSLSPTENLGLVERAVNLRRLRKIMSQRRRCHRFPKRCL
jgi:hypothetical protein